MAAEMNTPGESRTQDPDLKVLILEDLPRDAELMARALRKGGISCTTRRVDTREAFLKELAELDPGIILADSTLPAFDGLSALAIVKEKCLDVPFIFVTGTMGEERAIETMRRGATDYVLKSRLEKLAPAVQRALQETAEHKKRLHAEAELRRERRELAAGEARLRLIMDTTPDALIVIDTNGAILFANSAAGLLFGRKEMEIFGTDFGFPAIGEETTEIEVPAKNGSVKTAEMRTADIAWEGKAAFLVSFRDITDRKAAEDEARLNLIRQKALLDLYQQRSGASISEIINFTVDKCVSLTGSSIGFIGLITADEKFMEAHLFSEKAMVDCNLDKPASFPIEQAGLWAEPIRQRQPVICNDYRAADPLKRGLPSKHVELSRYMGIPVLDKDKGHVAAIASLGNKASDYSEGDIQKVSLLLEGMWSLIKQKRAEGELLWKTAFLEAQVEATIDGILVVDDKGKRILANRNFLDLMKVPQHIRDDPDDAPLLRHVTERTAHPERFIEKIRYLYAHPEETSRDEVELKDGMVLERYSSPVLGKSGNCYGRIWTFHDITERKRAEAEREKMQRQLVETQKVESIGRLAGGIAHDFNNLLSVIQSYTDFALEGLGVDDPLRDNLLEVRKAGERAVALTRQLLAFSRKQMFQLVPLDLNQVATGIEMMLRRILGEDIDLVQLLAPDLGVVMADPGQIEQVIMNLVVNARDAMPEGGKLTIETANVDLDETYAAGHAGVKPGPYVLLAVTDTGCGMDDLTMASIFDPFFTTKPKGRGTGLGLSMVYGIVKQSGGNIWVYSELGKGTTFKIYLPRELTAVASVPTSKAVSKITVGTETILVVEDEEAVRKLATRILSGAGYTVLTAANGSDALSTCERHPGEIHLVLTDVVMPEMSGRAFVERLAKVRPAIKVMYMSGYTDSAIVHHGVLDPGTRFIGKPFTVVDLRRKVREVLDEEIPGLSGRKEEVVGDRIETKNRAPSEDALRSLPREVTNELRKAVVTARYDEMVAVVESIRPTEPDVAEALRRMVEDFDYDGILDLIGHSS